MPVCVHVVNTYIDKQNNHEMDDSQAWTHIVALCIYRTLVNDGDLRGYLRRREAKGITDMHQITYLGKTVTTAILF